MAAILRIPEKSGAEILLAYKLAHSDAQLETASELSYEVNNKRKYVEIINDSPFMLGQW